MQEAGLSPFHLPQTPTKYIYSTDLRNYVPVDAQPLTNHILDLRSFNDVIEWEQTSDGLCTKNSSNYKSLHDNGKPRAPLPFLYKRDAMFHEDLVVALRLGTSFLRITPCLFLAFGHNFLLPRVSGRWSLAMLCAVLQVTDSILVTSKDIKYTCLFLSSKPKAPKKVRVQ